jgi:heme-degrading monooxygenase HmoA
LATLKLQRGELSRKSEVVMPFVRIAVDTFQPGTTDEVLSRVKQAWVDLFEHQPGFLAYEVVKTGENSAIFINTWETREQAEAAAQSAASWVKDNVAGMVVAADTYVGELAVSSRG